MTGGGFGGCTVSLVEADRSTVRPRSVDGYRAATGLEADVRLCAFGRRGPDPV